MDGANPKRSALSSVLRILESLSGSSRSPPRREDAPAHIAAPRHWPATLKLTDLGLEPTIDWTGGLRASWCPGEAGASEQLNRFLEEALVRVRDGKGPP